MGRYNKNRVCEVRDHNIFFSNQHFITDWFVQTGFITYKLICWYIFFFNQNYVWCKSWNWRSDITCSLRSLAFCVGRNFGEASRNFTNFWQNFASRISRNKKICTLRNYAILLISCFASNIILIEKKKWSTDSFVSDDPRVYEPVCYETIQQSPLPTPPIPS